MAYNPDIFTKRPRLLPVTGTPEEYLRVIMTELAERGEARIRASAADKVKSAARGRNYLWSYKQTGEVVQIMARAK